MKQVTRSLLSLALLGALAGGVGVFAWLRSTTMTGGGAQHEDTLVHMDTDRIVRFEVAEQGHTFRVERRDDGGWDVATPVRIAADPKQVEQILNGIGRLRAKKRFSPKDPPPSESDMGLDPAGAVVSAWTDDEPPRQIRVELGSTSAFNHQEYARVLVENEAAAASEPAIVMLASGSRRSIVRTAEQLYDRRVLGARTDEIVRLRVEPREPTPEATAFTIERAPGSEASAGFRCTEPFEGEVDQLVVRRVMEGLGGAPVSELLTLDAGGDLAPFGLHEPAFTVTAWIRPAGAAEDAPLLERKLFIGPIEGAEEDVGNRHVRVARSDQPWVGVANAILGLALPHSVEALKTKRVTSVDRTLVRRIEMELASGEHVAVERGEGQQAAWRLLAPEPGRAKPQAVNAFLLAMSNLTGIARALEGKDVTDAVKLTALGVDDHARRVRLIDAKGEILVALRLGKQEGDDVFVMREGADFVARVAKKRLADLPEKASELLD